MQSLEFLFDDWLVSRSGSADDLESPSIPCEPRKALQSPRPTRRQRVTLRSPTAPSSAFAESGITLLDPHATPCHPRTEHLQQQQTSMSSLVVGHPPKQALAAEPPETADNTCAELGEPLISTEFTSNDFQVPEDGDFFSQSLQSIEELDPGFPESVQWIQCDNAPDMDMTFSFSEAYLP